MLTRWLLAGVLAGSALLTTVAPSRAAHAASAPTIAFVNINFEAIYFQQLNAGARQMANKLHAHLVIYNANNNPQAQNSAIEAEQARADAAGVSDRCIFEKTWSEPVDHGHADTDGERLAPTRTTRTTRTTLNTCMVMPIKHPGKLVAPRPVASCTATWRLLQ